MNFKKQYDIEQYKLGNGLNVILYHYTGTALACTNLYYKVGSSKDPQGYTGLAHLVEHLMFEGTKNVKKGEHFQLIEKFGGSANAYTDKEKTVYYQFMPAEYIELMLYLEAERMFNIFDSVDNENLENQKQVVLNERYQRYDNRPYGMVTQLISDCAFPENHPYRAPVIGYEEDIKKYNLNVVNNFYKTYYLPNNASLLVAGNFDKIKVKEYIDKYFNKKVEITPVPEIDIKPYKFTQNSTIVHYDNIKIPEGYIIFKTCDLYNNDSIVLNFIAELLTRNNSGLLMKKYFFEEKSVVGINSVNNSLKKDGYFYVSFKQGKGFSLDEIKDKIVEDLANLKNIEFSDFMLQKNKNLHKAFFLYKNQLISLIADMMNSSSVIYDDPLYFRKKEEIIYNLKLEDIHRVAEKYFTNQFYSFIKYLPKNK